MTPSRDEADLVKKYFRLIIFFLISLIFLYFFFRKVDWSEVAKYLTEVNPLIFTMSILLTPLHLLTRGARWRFLLLPEKSKISLWNLFASNAVGFTVTFLFPGRLGELVKPLYLAQKEGIKKGFVLGTVVVERTFDIFTMCFLLGLFLVAQPLYSALFKIDEAVNDNLRFWGSVALIFASFLLMASLLLYFFKDPSLRLISFFLRPLPLKVRQSLLGLAEEFIIGLKFFHSLKAVLIYIALSFLVWLLIIFYYWVFFLAYGVNLSFFFLFPYVFLTMVGASIPTPGMVGGFHYFSKLALTSIYGLDPNLAVGITLVTHALQLVVTCLIGYGILWKEGISFFQIVQLREKGI
ncbi:MAG: flippase-like domain-containing protein [Candidatus Aminicenantes bacterium]|nr:flippase-like domain-containing protein [Candidatus Aminicenantes bacterium]